MRSEEVREILDNHHGRIILRIEDKKGNVIFSIKTLIITGGLQYSYSGNTTGYVDGSILFRSIRSLRWMTAADISFYMTTARNYAKRMLEF